MNVEFFKEGFFGYGNNGDFKQWSLAHFLPIIFMIVVLILLYKYREKIRNWKHEENLRFGFVVIMLLVEMSYFWRLLYVGAEGKYPNLMTKLPIQVCQWTLLTTCFMMAKKSKALFSMDFFLTMSTGIIPLFVPAVISTTGPKYWRYYQFWGEHILPIVGMYYMMFVHEYKPKKRGIIYAMIMLTLLAVPSIYFNNKIPEASYLYLNNSEAFEMLAFLPKTLWGKIPLFVGVVVALFFAAYGIYTLVVKYSTKKKDVKTK